ncbi:hypothetical protein JOB18_003641 [Solea senegalensis]|uniref:Uncharacterized protein n=1 Tax=Solea senegalensis TaxID=28829 RepID=A0AAV6SDZ4_SOLSE|nr:hypothetical protein JOB18_003641 [Solea senegalensis]
MSVSDLYVIQTGGGVRGTARLSGASFKFHTTSSKHLPVTAAATDPITARTEAVLLYEESCKAASKLAAAIKKANSTCITRRGKCVTADGQTDGRHDGCSPINMMHFSWSDRNDSTKAEETQEKGKRMTDAVSRAAVTRLAASLLKNKADSLSSQRKNAAYTKNGLQRIILSSPELSPDDECEKKKKKKEKEKEKKEALAYESDDLTPRATAVRMPRSETAARRRNRPGVDAGGAPELLTSPGASCRAAETTAFHRKRRPISVHGCLVLRVTHSHKLLCVQTSLDVSLAVLDFASFIVPTFKNWLEKKNKSIATKTASRKRSDLDTSCATPSSRVHDTVAKARGNRIHIHSARGNSQDAIKPECNFHLHGRRAYSK